jgi:SSS family solute:Na+ symporter
MELLDWVIVGLYVVIAVGIGAYFTKRAAGSTTDFFVAGRTLPWFVAGTSIVATTFAADTPIFVAGMSRDQGIWSNWIWWSFAIGQIASVFFFARLWRRSEVVTDVEFVAKRYDPSLATSALRIFRACVDGVFINCGIMASVTLAMTKIVKVLLDLSDEPLFAVPIVGEVTSPILVLVILAASAVLYSTLSGLYGVVYTDLIQFGMAIIGSIGLAIIVYVDASKGPGLISKLESAPEFKERVMVMLPDLSKFDLATVSFFILISMGWWAGAAGSGYTTQRLLATKSEKDAVLAMMWYNFCHYVIRPWPWIVVGVLSLIYLPNLADKEVAFPEMIDQFLPVGLKGIMVAAMLAAFMSTLDTHLNWGTSYLVNDVYRPYILPGRDARHYVLVSRVCMLLLTLAVVLIVPKLDSVLDTQKYLMVISGGIGTVLIARWYWWRVSALSEISAIIAAVVIGNLIAVVLPDVKDGTSVVKDYFAVRAAITSLGVLMVWVTFTLMGNRQPSEQTLAFYRHMRISGPGWRRAAEITGVAQPVGELRRSLVAWLLCCVLLFSVLLGMGKALFLDWPWALGFTLTAVVSGILLWKQIKKISFD